MNTDSFYLAMSGDSLDDIVKPEMKQAYEAEKKNWLVTDEFSKRTPCFFKLEFVGTRGAWFTTKCYLVQNKAGKNKYNCKGVTKEHNDLNFQRYKDALDVFLRIRRDSELQGGDIYKVKNVSFKVYDQGIVTYEQKKLGLLAYYNKRCVLDDGIDTRLLDFWTKFF